MQPRQSRETFMPVLPKRIVSIEIGPSCIWLNGDHTTLRGPCAKRASGAGIDRRIEHSA